MLDKSQSFKYFIFAFSNPELFIMWVKTKQFLKGRLDMVPIVKQNTEGRSGHKPSSDYWSRNFRPVKSTHISRDAGEPCVLTIVKTDKFGKRISFANEVHEAIGSPDSVQIAVNDDGIVIGATLPGSTSSFKLRKNGKKPVIYAAGLVEEIAELFDLDFSDGRSSLSFREVEYIELDSQMVAFVPLRQADAEQKRDVPAEDNE